MKLGNKNCYPQPATDTGHASNNEFEIAGGGLTFRERLIVALASNPNIIAINEDSGKEYLLSPVNAVRLIKQADSIIKQLEGEQK